MKKIYASILITNYNKQKFLNKALRSCINQRYKNKEILLYDDCSTDNSINIIKKFKSIKLILNKKKKYISGPLNQIDGLKKLIKIAKGEIIFLLDSDDEFKKNKLKDICDYLKINKKKNFLQDVPFNKKLNRKIYLKERKFNLSIWPRFYPTSTIVVRKKFLKNFVKIDLSNEFPNLEIDARICIFAHLNNEFTQIKKSFTIYNFDHNGITSNYKKFRKNWWLKRSEAFQYMSHISKKLNINFNKGFDFYVTKLVNFFIRLYMR